MTPLITSGKLCCPFGIDGSIRRKSTVKTRPSSVRFVLVICVSDECRSWSCVPPYVPQSPGLNGFAATALAPPDSSVVASVGGTVGAAAFVPPVFRDRTPLAKRPTKTPPAARTSQIARRLRLREAKGGAVILERR